MTKRAVVTRPKRISERLIKLANALNAAAELQAELVVGLQDAARACVRLAEELEVEAKN